MDRCDKCPALWDDYDSYLGDGDYGCAVFGDKWTEKPCKIPMFIIKLAVIRKKREEKRYWDRIYKRELKSWKPEG